MPRAEDKPEEMIFLPLDGLPPEAVRAGKALAAKDPLDAHVRSAVEVLTAVAEVRAPGVSAYQIARAAAVLAAAVSANPRARLLAFARVWARLGPARPTRVPVPMPKPKGRHRASVAPVRQRTTPHTSHAPTRRQGVLRRALGRLLSPLFDWGR